MDNTDYLVPAGFLAKPRFFPNGIYIWHSDLDFNKISDNRCNLWTIFPVWFCHVQVS